MQIVKRTTSACPLKGLPNTLVLLIGLVASQPAAALEQPVNPPCSRFEGTFVATDFRFTSQTMAEARGHILIGGEIVGGFAANYENIQQQGNGVMQMNAAHKLTLPGRGTLVTTDEILLQLDDRDPGWARANSRLYIVGGTGEFAGATGLLHTHGVVNLITLEGSVDFAGQVCVP